MRNYFYTIFMKLLFENITKLIKLKKNFYLNEHLFHYYHNHL